MSRLLSAGLKRLFKGKSFWISIAVMAGIGIFAIVTNYIDVLKGEEIIHIDKMFFSYTLIVLFPLAAFTGLSIGTEYSDGTLRNKLIIGHRRTEIYLANLLITIFASILFCLAAIIPMVILGYLLLAGFNASVAAILMLIGMAFVTSLAVAGLFTMICMLKSNKASACVIVLVVTVVLFVGAAILDSMLQAPEYYDGWEMSDESGQLVQGEKELNTSYLTGVKREIYQNIYDFLPTGQMMQISSMDVEQPVRLMIYAVLLFILTTGFGLVRFKTKDLS